MTDRFKSTSSGINGPANDGFIIAPDDGLDLNEITRAIFIGSGGDISLVTKNGTLLTFSGLGAGSLLPVRASRVHATGTTASNIVGLV